MPVRRPAVMRATIPGAFAAYSLGSSPGEIARVLVGLFGLAVLAYVVIPVLKTLGTCLSARIEAVLMPSGQQRGRRSRIRKRRSRTVQKRPSRRDLRGA